MSAGQVVGALCKALAIVSLGVIGGAVLGYGLPARIDLGALTIIGLGVGGFVLVLVLDRDFLFGGRK